ncbi:alpha/beta hydrolase [Putridiphycobacter roseus]|uniref:Alpha/beta hydrolase n=2 Tax=Putridiphycobacter roseus TaxID=2219161 RepID=A0A2W1NA17_9FLAO|nr:alpha/beta hydrolase [Putridiphycobacter roseus]
MKKNILFFIVLVLAASCGNKSIIYKDPIPAHDSLRIFSKFINEERVINIWTPPNYDSTTDSLMVIYMPDGGIKEDFPHIANTLDTLIKQNKMPNVILVGIENTVRRRDLAGPSNIEYDLKYIPNPGGAENFRKFIKEELFPEIDQRYSTNNQKAIIGESLAGLFIIETLILEPTMFDYYIAMDPSLWFNENYLVKNFESLTEENNYANKKLWYAGSSVTDISTYTNKLEQKLKDSKGELIWKYEDEPNEKHHTIYRATKEKALIWIFSDFQ